MTQDIEISSLKIHPKNVRKEYRGIEELTESIKAKGILQNLTVVPDTEEPGTYIVVIGNRRLTAARKAGLETVPCVIAEMDEREQAQTMLLENLQRDDLTIYEQAQGFQMVLDLGGTEDELAEKTGFSKTTIRRRLNIAKLDQNVLQEKEKEGEFQLSLTDLYELEKIKSVEDRDKILKEARNSREIASSVNRIIAEEERKKTAQQIVKLLNEKGITEAPANVSTEIYGNKWETIKSYDLRKEAPESIDIKPEGNEKIYWLKYWNEIKVIRKAKKVKREKTLEEKKKDEKDSRKKKVKAIAKEMAALRRDFALDLIAGKVKPLKDDTEVNRTLWSIMLESSAYITGSGVKVFLLGKQSYDFNDEEKQEAQEKMEKLSVSELTLLSALKAVEEKEFMERTGEYNKSTGAIMQKLYGVLEQYGYSMRDEEAKLVEGTHDLYTAAEVE